MQRTYKEVIADTSCFILLDKIDELVVLKELFSTIIVTPEIVLEYKKPLPEWIGVKPVQDRKFQENLFQELDKGEASIIALAIELQPSLLIIDDLKGRKTAKRLQLPYTGSLGALLMAKKKGIIRSLRPVFSKIRSTNFHISSHLLDDILKETGEI